MDITLEGEEGEKANKYVAIINSKPSIEGLISEVSIDATFYEANQTLKDSTTYDYISPTATDEDKDEIKLSVSGQEEKSFMKVTVDNEKPLFILQIDRKLIKETDKGSFVLKIKASDGKETVE